MILRRVSIRSLLVPVLSMGLLFYFTYHIFRGERGVLALFHIRKEVAMLEMECQGLQKQREVFERRVYLLRPDSLDLDLLEERVRFVLHFAHPSEIVVKNTTIGQKINP